MCFKNSEKHRVASNGYETFYTDKVGENSRYRYYNITDTLCLINYLLNNSYCKFINKIYKQNIGLPQGGNCSPLLANLTMSMFEYEFSKNTAINNSQFKSVSLGLKWLVSRL